MTATVKKWLKIGVSVLTLLLILVFVHSCTRSLNRLEPGKTTGIDPQTAEIASLKAQLAEKEKAAVAPEKSEPAPVDPVAAENASLKERLKAAEQAAEDARTQLSNEVAEARKSNGLPDGVSITHMPEKSGVKSLHSDFFRWETQGNLVFPMIRNSKGNPTPIRSAVPPPGLPGEPKGQWSLEDYVLQTPGGPVNLKGWAKQM